MSVSDWMPLFVEEHRTRHGAMFLPELDSPEGQVMYRSWRSVFVAKGVHDYDVATAASELLTGESLPHSSLHFPRLCEIAVGIYKSRNAANANSGLSQREIAAQESKDCGHCSGTGLAVVWRRDDPTRTSAAYCVCPSGRWTERTHREKSPDILRRIPDFDDAMRGRSAWVADRPDGDPALAAICVAFTPAELIREWTRRAVEEAVVEPGRAGTAKQPSVAQPRAVGPDWVPSPQQAAKARKAFSSAKALKCLTGFLLLGPQPELEVTLMAQEQGIDREDIDRAATALEVERYTANGMIMWRSS